MNGFAEILRLGIGASQASFEEFAGFLFHGMAVAGGPYAQPALGIFGELSNRNASHDCNDIIAIIDCIEEIPPS